MVIYTSTKRESLARSLKTKQETSISNNEKDNKVKKETLAENVLS